MKAHYSMLALATTLFGMPSLTHAQTTAPQDSVPETKEVKNRNIMLNASSDNQPRQISIGLPSSLSTTIYEDGLPVSYNMWPCLPYCYWASSSLYSRIGLTSIGENAITNGTVNYSVDSYTREGGDKFEGHANYTTNIYNLQRFDLSLAGPLKKGWSYSLGAYINMDPGTNDLADTDLATNMQMFKAGLTKRWNEGRGKASIFYKYVYYKGLSDSYGPFIYKGDGSVGEYEGFDLGHDGFLPGNGYLTYRDVVTGELQTINRHNGVHNMGNDVNFKLDYLFDNGMKLDVSSKYRYANAYMASLGLSGIGEADENSGYTYAYDTGTHQAGDVFTGKFNSRYLLRDIGYERNWMTTAELTGKSNNGKNNWRLGYNFWWERQGILASTGVYAHTVEANPVWLKHDGNQGYTFNTGGEFYDTHEIKTALYASDDWQATDRWWLSAGARLEYYNIGGQNAMAYLNATDTEATYPENIRSVDYSLNKGRITSFKKSWVNPAATLNTRLVLTKGFGLVGEYVYAMQHPNSQDFAGSYMPILDAVNVHFGRAGIFWNTPWMQLVSQFTLISQSNYKSRTQFTNPNDASDVVTIPITYDIQTMGWTTDVVLNPFKGFSFHGLFTYQNPLYKNFNIDAAFSDGTSKSYSFSNNVSTGVSKYIVELDPSYSFDKFRIWASFRYQSKQYINKTNTLYFNGRWETFAGVDYTLNKYVGFTVNFVNLLNEKGASGSIGAADLLEDVSAYKNYLMAGTYIRPFTAEFSVHVNF